MLKKALRYIPIIAPALLLLTVFSTAFSDVQSLAATEYFINAGGGVYTDSLGTVFAADQAYTAGDYGFVGGNVKVYTNTIAGTTDDPLYQDVRVGSSAFSYQFDNVATGAYAITLYFMEPTASNPGQRVVDLTVEGTLMLDDYDIFTEAGGMLTAHTKTINALVNDGQLNLDFDSNNKSIVSAIAVEVAVVEPDIDVSPASVDFGQVVVGTSSTEEVIVTNAGTDILTVNAITTTNGVFTILSPSTPFTLAVGAMQTVTLSFSPTITQTENGNLHISSDDPNEPVVIIPLTGEGVDSIPDQPDIAVSPTSVDFGSVLIGSSLDRVVTISNNGTAILNVSNITTTGGAFTYISPTVPFIVPVGGSVDATVRFSPTSAPLKTGELHISSDDPDEPIVIVPLQGSGNSGGTTYVDVAAAVGIVQSHTISGICPPPLTAGSAWADYDNDGDIDLFVTGHGAANRLYRNEGDTSGDGIPDFTDVAIALGVDGGSNVSLSVVFIDYDNDGDQDIYITNWSDVAQPGANTLFENQLIETGSVAFTDVTATAGIADGGRGITSAWGDFDNDGYLDMYVAKHRTCSGDFVSEDHLYHNDGDGTFTDVTSYLCGGATCKTEGLGFSPGWFDYDNDGDPDLYLVNDSNGSPSMRPNALWRNDGSDGAGGWNFTELAAAADAEFTVNGMGLGIADYDNDGYLDLAFSDIGPAHLLNNDGDGTFTDVSASSNVSATTAMNGAVVAKTWGSVFFDHDNDGWQDLYIVAGNTGSSPGDSYENFFMTNNGDGTFSDASAASGLNDDKRGRNASIVDFDGDGFVDVFVGNFGESPLLFHNKSLSLGNANHWLNITVQGTESNRDGIGTRLYLTAGGQTMMREISSGPTHGGGDYRAAFFGLGSETSGTLTINWPNGIVQNLGSLSADQTLHLVEPSSSTTYSDVTAISGLTLTHIDAPDCDPPLGSGSAWADYDNDGDIDFFATNKGGANYLYRNDGDTSGDGFPDFTDVAPALGVTDVMSYSHSAVFIDYDNDGDQDLYVTNWDGNILYENQYIESGMTAVSFTDVTNVAGVKDAGRAITSGWADYDNDGYLDFYIAKHKRCSGDNQSQDHLFHNNGDGTFTDVTSYLCGGAATCAAVEGFGFSPGWFDYDNDGDQDLYLVNDVIGVATWNVLWRNDGDDGAGGWNFTDVSAPSGADAKVHGMGLGVGDYDNDGDFDVAFSDVGPAELLQNQGDGTFVNVSVSSGISATTNSVTWGTAFFDHDNDGWLDLYYVAGNIGGGGLNNIMLQNQANGTFADISAASGLNDPGRGRSAAMVDYDEDGWVDIFVGNYNEPSKLYHNNSADNGNNNHYLHFTVEGTDSNRDGIGTRFYLTVNGVTMMREINSGPTHGGGDYRAAYFGLGTNISPTVEVHWPNGVVENLGTLTVDQAMRLVEPTALPITHSIDIAISNVTDAEISWSAQPSGCNVEAYWSDDPYFAVGEATLIDTLTGGETFTIDPNAIADASTNDYYAIRENCAGVVSQKSNEVGVFHFDIVPGTP